MSKSRSTLTPSSPAPHRAVDAASAAPRAESRPESRWLGRWFTASRREGLLALLPPEEWQTLSALLSFTSRDGRRYFTVDQLALTLGLSREQALERLERLVHLDWKGEPFATLERDATGEVAGAVLAPVECLAVPQASPDSESDSEASGVSQPAEAATPAGLLAELERVGLDPGQIDWLTDRYRPERIRRQLDWLPKRGARNPAAMLIRAIEQDWEPPREAA